MKGACNMAKVYTNKKDPEIKAKLVGEEPKYKTVALEYLNGKDAGKVINISEATLKRWWKVDNEVADETTDEPADETTAVDEPEELVTRVKPTKKSKPTIPAIDKEQKFTYLQLLADRYGLTLRQKKTHPYDVIVLKNDSKLGELCIKLRKFVLYTLNTLEFSDVANLIINEVNGTSKIEMPAEDSYLEMMMQTLSAVEVKEKPVKEKKKDSEEEE